MNYFEDHIGDYAAATAHLSWDEDMAYTRLIRAYYHTEKPIPADQTYRLARATTPAQRRAVDAVLSEFFTKQDDGWHQKRCDAEIARFHDKQAKAKRSANARWNPKQLQTDRNANASETHMRTHSEGNAPNHQAPDTRHQTPEVDNPSGLSPEQRASPAEICRDLKTAGIADVNPGHPRLLALCEAGAQPAEFLGFVPTAIDKAPGRGFAYVLGAVEGERKRAAQTAGSLHRGPMPGKQDSGETAYQRSMRERMAEAAPGLQRTAPGQPKPVVIDAESRQLESLQ